MQIICQKKYQNIGTLKRSILINYVQFLNYFSIAIQMWTQLYLEIFSFFIKI